MSEPTIPATENVGIQQLNLVYDVNQDRLLFRVGLFDNSELQLWMTNRVAKQIWQLLSGKTHLPTANSIAPQASPGEAVAQFQQELQATEALQKMDFATEYAPRTQVKNDGPMLAIGATLTNETPEKTTLHLACIEGMTINMNLNRELILAMCNMLHLSTKESGWEIGAPAVIPIVAVKTEQKVLH